MDNAKAVEILTRVGDPIERHIAQSAEHIPNALYPYAAIWAEHVLVRRKKGTPRSRTTTGCSSRVATTLP
jgi:hypothetical protein